MKQLTIRGFDEELATALRNLARSEGISLNQAALRLLRRGAGIGSPQSQAVVGHTLDHLAGTWSDEEAREFMESIRVCDAIDEAFWQ